MTDPIKLELVWADAGGSTDPTDPKYQLGWVAEIPTYQNFNHILKALDSAKLSFAESDVYPWQDLIAYKAGVKVLRNGIIYRCKLSHNDLAGTNPQDPALDTTRSYWVNGVVFSSKADAFNDLNNNEGVKLDQMQSRASRDVWESNDLTLVGKNSIVSLRDSAGVKNLLFGNVQGKLVVVNVGTTTQPDNSTLLLPSANADSFEIYHEGNKPSQGDVTGTIPDASANGILYGRKDGNWVEIDISPGGGTVDTILPGTGIGVDNTDPANPIVSSTVTGIVETIVPGTNVTVDNTDPTNPIVSSTASGGGGITQNDLLHIQHRTADGVSGGAMSEGTWNVAPFNTTVHNSISGASRSGSNILLPAGSYLVIDSYSSARHCDYHQAKLRDITGGLDKLIGETAYSQINFAEDFGDGGGSRVSGIFSLSTTSTLQLQHNCSGSGGGSFGKPIYNSGTFPFGFVPAYNLYRNLMIFKVS